MHPAHKNETNDLIRQQILAAAMARFSHYGYNKTTMAEIAEDTGMSAANLYRYFENKQDIMAACADQCVNDRIEALNLVLQDNKDNAASMLEQYALTTLYFSHKLASENRKINELVEVIKEQRPDVIYQRVDREVAIIRKILITGINTGQFRIDDIDNVAKSIHLSLVTFDVPIFMNLYPLNQFEEMARSIIKLVINGIKK